MFEGLRGVVHALVRGLGWLREAPSAIYDTLRTWGIEQPEIEFQPEVEAFTRAPDLVPSLAALEPDQLVMGIQHQVYPGTLEAKFNYVVRVEWEDLEGNVFEQFHSRSSKIRLTPNEIFETVEQEMAFYKPEGGVYHGPLTLHESWTS